MVRKIGARKGDVTISTVILIVLGLAVLVMMIIGFTKGWDVIFGIFDNAPSELQTLAKACVLYAQGSLRIDFCSYKLVGDEIVNCRDPRILDSLKKDGVNTEVNSLRCDGISDKIEVQRDACRSLAGGKSDVKINSTVGLTTCEALLGTPCTGTSTGPYAACNTFFVESQCKSVPGCTWSL